MKLNDLYIAIKELGSQEYFYLNDKTKMNTYILEYNKKNQVWEYYFLDERGGKSSFKTFIIEEDACKYVLNAAIDSIKIFRDAYMDAVRRKYLG